MGKSLGDVVQELLNSNLRNYIPDELVSIYGLEPDINESGKRTYSFWMYVSLKREDGMGFRDDWYLVVEDSKILPNPKDMGSCAYASERRSQSILNKYKDDNEPADKVKIIEFLNEARKDEYQGSGGCILFVNPKTQKLTRSAKVLDKKSSNGTKIPEKSEGIY